MRKAASQPQTYSKHSTFTFIFVSLCAVSLIFVQAALAWSTQQSAQAYCEGSSVKIKATFKNTEPVTSNLGMNVVVMDEQSNQSVTIGAISPGQTKDGVINTGKTSVNAGRVKFSLTWTSGQSGVDTRYANYASVACVQPSPTVAPTAIPTVVPTAQPTTVPTVAPTTQPTVVPTVAPTANPTIAPTTQPTAAPTATPVPPIVSIATAPPRTDLTDGRSDGRGCSVNDCSGNVVGNPTAVAGVSTDRSLPTTGAKEMLYGVMTLVAVSFGFYFKLLAKKQEKTMIAELKENTPVIFAKLS